MSYEEFLKLLKSVYKDNLEKIKNIHDEIEDDNYVHLNNNRQEICNWLYNPG